MKIGVLDFKEFRIEDVDVPAEEFEPFIKAVDRVASAIRAGQNPPSFVSERSEKFYPPSGAAP